MSCWILLTGTLSEYFSASRTRTGPRSLLSALGGLKPLAMSVRTSMTMVAGLITPDSKPAAYVIGLKADPDCRKAWPMTSNFGWWAGVASPSKLALPT